MAADPSLRRNAETCTSTTLSSPSNGLYRVATVDLTYNAAVEGYDLTGVTDVLAVLDARYQAVGSEQDWLHPFLLDGVEHD